ncbi:MAG TPA: cyclase family protein [Gaiellaceae bacterium]|nr:cyclase family protein [Gaiellaceae bacterium]
MSAPTTADQHSMDVDKQWPYELIDLSRPLTVETVDALMGDIVSDGRNPYFRDISIEVAVDHTQSNAHSCILRIPDHAATHMDAPIHAVDGAGFLEQVDIRRLIGIACVLDLSGHDTDHGYTAADLAAASPTVREGDIVLIYSGFQDAHPGERMHQTYLTGEAAQWLVDQGAHAVGMEPASPDPIYAGMYEYGWLEKNGPHEPAWPAHTVLLKNDVYIIEGLTNLDRIKGERVQFAALPPLIPGLSGAPVRAVAWR